MEYETPVTDVVERRRAPMIDPVVEATADEVSVAEQTAAGPQTGDPVGALQPSVVMGLQRTAGNAAVTALVQRRLASAEEQDTEAGDERSPVLDVVRRGGGQPLDPDLKDEMEARLGDDFTEVRVHTDRGAAESAAAVSARGYTVGNEIVLGADSPALDSADGKRTLAHELTHVLQQRSGPVAGTPTGDGISISDPSDRFEQAAEANATRAMSDRATDTGPSPSADGQAGPVPTQRDGTEEASELTDEAPRSEEELETQPVQGIWIQRAPAGSAIGEQVDQEEEEADEEEAEKGEEEVEAEDQANDVEVEQDEADGEAEDQATETDVEEEEAEAEADNQTQEEEEEAEPG